MSIKIKCRSIFLSDLHLGTRNSQAELLNEFLKTVECQELYLLGDIIDIALIKRRLFWDKHHNAIFKRLFKLAQKGVKITYIAGNHDVDIRQFEELNFAGIIIKNEIVYTSKLNKKYLLLHGDKFDGILNEKLWFLYTIGDHCYEFAVFLNRPLKIINRLFNKNYSLSGYLKSKVKNAVKFISNFEHLVVNETKKLATDGVICGHIHTAADQKIGNIHYLNCGCWTDDSTAIIEHHNGEFELIRYTVPQVEKLNKRINKKCDQQ